MLQTIGTTKARHRIIIINFNNRAIQSCLNSRTRAIVRGRRLNANRTILRTRPLLRNRTNALLIAYNSAPLIAGRAFATLVRYRRRDNTTTAILATRVPSPAKCNHIVHSRGKRIIGVIRRGSNAPRRLTMSRMGTNVCYFSVSLL